jgi:cation diffusion facilitator CzcD-associated flavoprotein CzcO
VERRNAGACDSPAGADWITIASVVLEPRAENGLRDVRVAIVGAGFGGIGTAIRLREAGYEDLVILERDDGLGGTWWANTYPGCACDVAAHLYSFSFALNPDWSRFFAPQAEILDYLRNVARDRGIEPLIRFGTEVTGARWDEHASRWRVETDRGAFSAQVLVSAAGGLTEPKLPTVPGLDSFAGTTFHSARWDHGHDLSGERVGVIGTGSTASQIVPEVQKHAARLTVFQRSPGWVVPRLDHPHSDLQKLLLRRFPALQRAIRSAIYYNNELLILGLVRRPRLLAGLERLALGYLKRQVPDAEIRAKLTPDYRIGCKRIIISSDFLGTFMKPNVELVSEGIRKIVPNGIVTQDGRKIELDTIIFATGFDVMNPPHFRHVVGRGGRSIREVWDEDGIRAYLGTVIPGFPNHFVLLGPNTASGNNSALQPIEAQIGFAIDALRAMDARGATAVDVRRDVMERFDDEIQRRLAPTVWNSGGCHSWYVGADGRNFTIWPAFANEYKRRLARFDPAEFELTSAPVAVAKG